MFTSNNDCVDKLLFALKQGCKIKNGMGNRSCVSPPQWADDTVMGLGARAEIEFNVEEQKIQINSLVCDGD